MGRKFRRVETRHLRAPLDDGVDGTGFQCPRGNIAPSIDFSKHVAFVDPAAFSHRVRHRRDVRSDKQFHPVRRHWFWYGQDGCQAREGEPSSSVTGACLTSCSVRRPAISLRRRPPEAKATIRMARSRKAVRSSPEQVASSLPRISPVIALALLRLRGRFRARTASRIADLTEGDENAPSGRASGSASTSWQDGGARLPVHAVPTRAESLVGAIPLPRRLACRDRVQSRVAAAARDDGQRISGAGLPAPERGGLPVAAIDHASR